MPSPQEAYLIWISPLWKARRNEQGGNSRARFSPRVYPKVYIPGAGLGKDIILFQFTSELEFVKRVLLINLPFLALNFLF